MTSVRPKLKPATPKTVTAWETESGQVIYMTAEMSWTTDPAQLGIFVDTAADDALAAAKAQEGRVTDPYFMEVSESGAITGRETLRETIRAQGPTVHPQFRKTETDQ